MLKLIICSCVAFTVLLTGMASISGWGLQKPEKKQKSVRHGSRHVNRSRHGFLYLGRGHSHYSGK